MYIFNKTLFCFTPHSPLQASDIVIVLAAVDEAAPSGLGTTTEKVTRGVREKLREHGEIMEKVYEQFTR